MAWLVAAVTAGVLVVGCYDSGCPSDSYELELGVTVAPEDCPAGSYVLRGEADGVPFSCPLECLQAGDAITIAPGPCEGGAVVESLPDGGVAVTLPGTPDLAAVELAAVDTGAALYRRELHGGTGSGCGGPLFFAPLVDRCTNGLTLALPASNAGDHEFAGTADGVAFGCTYSVVRTGSAALEARDATCTGDVALRIDRIVEGESERSQVHAFFAGSPAEVVWSFTAPGEGGPATTTGNLAPVYAFDDEGCRVAAGEVL